ncbi:S8 family serine peptidase, partial [Helicobacter equorum]|uniref:S8 family serine peptidase n=1 Tax=Helicobacter equorum TaxID=361872 RepID=UPI0013151E0F
MLKPIALSFALVSLGQADTFLDNLKKDWRLINYDENIVPKGEGVAIGFIDSAFNLDHPSLANKGITEGSNELSLYERDAFSSAHGTHVAGIAVGNDYSNDKIHGIAPKAGFYGLSYLNTKYPYSGNQGDIYDFFKNSGVKVINNSWSNTYYPFVNKEIVDDANTFVGGYKQLADDITATFVFSKVAESIGLQATVELTKAGILQIYSSGNQGQLSPSINSSLPTYDEGLKAWISVGAFDSAHITKSGDNFTFNTQRFDTKTQDYRGGFTSFSNAFLGSQAYGILAPGYDIGSANAYYENEIASKSWKGSNYLCLGYEFCPQSGTSQAAPFVSGAAALVAEKYPFAGGRLLADILLSTANSNVELPEIILKRSPVQWSASGVQIDKHYYYNVIYTSDVDYLDKKDKVKADLQSKLNMTADQAEEILTHLMYNDGGNFAKHMTKEELIGQGILDIEKALKGLGKLDANRLLDSDVKQSFSEPNTNQAFYTIDTKGQNGEFSNDIEQKTWEKDWHLDTALNAPKKLAGIDKIGLEKTGDGTLTLSGTNTYKGDTIASGGTLKLTGSLTESSVFAQNGGTFELSGGTIKKDATALNGGVFSITGSNNNIVDGTLTSKNGGIILFNENSTLNAGGVVNNGGTLLFNKGSNLTATKGVDVQNSGLLKGQGTITGNLTNSGILKAGFYDEVTDTADKLGNLEVKGKFTQNTDGILQIAFTKSSETSSEVKNSTLSANSYDIKGSLVYVPLHTTASLIKANDEIQINLDTTTNTNNNGLKSQLDKFTSVTAQSTNLLVFNIDNTDKTKLVAALKVTDGANADITKA